MAVISPATVLVTGANGFISVWICRILLEQGYNVRGTVRDNSKGQYLVKLFEQYQEKFEYVIVIDVAAEGAFDEAVKGVHAVMHTASPVGWSGKPDDTIRPAVNGTRSILNSILKHGTNVRRAVVTSSAAVLLEPHESGYLYTEADWNESCLRRLREKGDDTDGVTIYIASKVLAEKAAMEFVKEHEKSINWQLVTLLPTYVWGDTTAIKEPNASMMLLYDSILKEKPSEDLGKYFASWVDVRDTALAHVLAIQKDVGAVERFIISGGSFTWQDIYDAANSVRPPLVGIPVGRPDVPREFGTPCSSEKSKEILGMRYRSLEECVRDAIVSIGELFPSM